MSAAPDEGSAGPVAFCGAESNSGLGGGGVEGGERGGGETGGGGGAGGKATLQIRGALYESAGPSVPFATWSDTGWRPYYTQSAVGH